MKKIRFIVYIILICCTANIINAQNSSIDSLQTILRTAKDDTNKVKHLRMLSHLSHKNSNYDDAIRYAKNALSLAQQLNYKKGIADSYLFVGIGYYWKSDFSNAIAYHKKALTLNKELNRNHDIVKSLIALGEDYFWKGDYPIALNYFLEALKITEKFNYSDKLVPINVNLGQIYMEQENYELALECFLKAFQLSKEKENFHNYSSILGNLALIYTKQQKYTEAIEIYNKSLEIARKKNDKYAIAGNLTGLSDLYLQQLQYKKALTYSLEAYSIFKEIGEKSGIISTCGNIGSIYLYQKKYSEAEKYLIEAKNIAISVNSMKLKIEVYEKLSLLYEKSNKPAKSLEYFKLYKYSYDSLYNAENSKQMGELKTNYAVEKKELELKAAQEKKDIIVNEEKRIQKLILYAVLLGLGLVVVFSGVIYNRFKITQKQRDIINEQKQEVEAQKNITEKQKNLVELKNHEITQSIQYAQKIQSALLPSEILFKNTLPDSFVIFKPKDIVSGDFYWISEKHKQYVFYVTADSTGHGVPGGFMSMLGTALLNEIIDERKIENCGEALTLMREKIMDALKQAGDSESKDGMDMVLIRIDKLTLEMQYAAANNSVYIVSNTQSAISNEHCILHTEYYRLFELPCDKMPVGVYHSEVKPFTTHTYQLQKGDIIYTYTDGYADQFGGNKGKKYTYKRLREKLLAISQKPLENQKTTLENEFISWKSDNEQIDDVCLIGVKI